MRARPQAPAARPGDEPAPHPDWARLRHVRRHPGDVLRVLVGGLPAPAAIMRSLRAAGVRTPAVLTAAPTGDGHVLLVQEYVAGQTLDHLDAARVDDRLLAAAWVEVARLHAVGIAHRDLRRANVLVGLDGQPWLLDFGFAEAATSRRRLVIPAVRAGRELAACCADRAGPPSCSAARPASP